MIRKEANITFGTTISKFWFLSRQISTVVPRARIGLIKAKIIVPRDYYHQADVER